MKTKRLTIPDYTNNIYYNENPTLFLLLKTLVENHIKGFLWSLISNLSRLEYSNYHELRNWINKSLPLLSDPIYGWNTKCYWILFNLSDFPKCPICNNIIGYMENVKITKGYKKHCCPKCSAIDKNTKDKRIKTTRKLYGVDNINLLETIKEQKELYFLNTYGVKCSLQIPEVLEHTIAKNLETYGVKYYCQTDECKNKIKLTVLELYHVTCVFLRDDILLKKLEKNRTLYGVDHFFQSNKFKEIFKLTMLNNYNVENPMLVRLFFLKTICSYVYDNKSFSSKPELAFYIYLRDKNIDFEYLPECSFLYLYDGKMHKYFPDFKINDLYLELKGDLFLKEDGTWKNPYDHSLDLLYEAKHLCCIKNNVKILYTCLYMKYLEYILEKYGKNYLDQFKKV